MKQFLGMGIAGNFANHLEQAGEANDFKNIQSDEQGAPKGIFPFYVPNHQRLGRYCFDNQYLILPSDTTFNVQAEPEVALECEVIYEDHLVKDLIPKFFMAFNDSSVRNDKNAKKISEKKNFSEGSKAVGNKIAIDQFSAGGICDSYSIVSFVKFDQTLHLYGKCSPLTTYSYFYEKLIEWTKRKLNTQEDVFVLENLRDILKQNNYPNRLILAIGATCYTEIGEKRFLEEGDEVFIIVFNHHRFSLEQVKELINKQDQNACNSDISIIKQKVIRNKV